ncbi:MAG TPA: hypothetical protein PKX87_05775 [Alphaproteobacteria bacterium]|nr:hypothetical protein [Alphaproteobacteria bacterium]
MSNRGLMIVIVVLLLGVFAIVAMQYGENRKTPGEKVAEGVSEAIDNAGDSIREGVEEVGDEIDDHTTGR